MITQKCKQCGKTFTLTQSEIDAYISIGLNLPQTCEECSMENDDEIYSKKYNPKEIHGYNKNYYKKKELQKVYDAKLTDNMIQLIGLGIGALITIVLGWIFF